MTTYQHLLLALDFSESDQETVQKAQDFARLMQAKLSLIHVLDNIPMPDTPYGTEILLNADVEEELLDINKGKLLAWGEKLGVALENLWLVWGIPKQEMTRIAKEQAVDLIIVGSHGRHGLALLLGSTVDGVVHHAPCDVLVVKLLGD